MMDAVTLQAYLHEHIPLSRAMQVSVVSASVEEVVLGAPLAPNINHRETVFGGSASAVCILAAWSLVHVRLQAAGTPAKLVIHRNLMEYLLPVHGDFLSRARITSEDAWRHFARVFERRGKSRIAVAATLEIDGVVAGRLAGTFVAVS
jgi:thioesterase domain-containing protein